MSSNDISAHGFVSTAIEGGGTWTHTTRLGYFLAEAEAMFGPRQMDWTILGVEFFGDIPHIWFPGDRKHVAIRLTESARLDLDQALFQLAHETVHLLSPNGGGSALIIEEGMASVFADVMMSKLSIMNLHSSGNYIEARDLVSSLVNIQSDAIREFRSTCPRIQDFTPDLIMNVAPAVRPAHAQRLCERFDR